MAAPAAAATAPPTWIDQALGLGMDIGLKILGAFVLWIVGRFVIKMALKAVGVHAKKRGLDATLTRYLDNFLGITLNVVLIAGILSVFGVETTTFAAVFAAAGVAIGLAWSGLLSNFAAGVFLVLLRPFKVGDFVQGGGIIGTVVEVGLFVTTIDTMDNVRTFIGNAKLFGGNIQNFTANPFRRVERTAQLAHSVDVNDAIARLKTRLAAIPGVAQSPAPDVEVLDFNLAGPVLAVRPYCHNDVYWDVFFATNAAIADEFGKAGYPVPQQHYHHTQIPG